MLLRFSFGVLCAAGLAGNILASPPVNDSFASRTVLTLAGATGTNAEATVESGEPRQLPEAPASGTVWWTFTPPADGWYELSTAGSGFDTVLSIYRGTDVSSLVRIASADDDALDDSVSTSRVRFQAGAGESFAIQAGSFNNAIRGPIALSVQAITEPLERVNSLSFSPGEPFDVSAGDQNVIITFSLRQNSALDFGTLFISRPDGGALRSWEFTAAQRISGTSTAGTYQLSAVLPRYAAAGNYPLWITASSVNPGSGSLPLENGGWVWTSLPSGATPYFSVTNTGPADSAAPAVSDAVFTPPAVDVTTAGVVVPLSLRITDDLSGFTAGAVSLEQTVNATTTDTLAAGTLAAANRTAGTAMDGQYQVQLLIPQDAPAGVWQLRCDLTDSLGNTASVVSPATLTVNKNPWASWVKAQNLTGASALPDADPDLDGLPNLQEFAWHTDPKVPDLRRISPAVPERAYRFRGATPYFFTAAGEWHVRFLRRRGANAGPVTAVPFFSHDLTDWTTGVETTVTPFSADWEMVEARDPAGAGLRRFGRILVTLP